MANSESNSDFEINFDSNSDKEVEVSNLKNHVKVSKYIDEFCLSLKTSLKMISELKIKNFSKLTQQEISWKEKFENLDKTFVDLVENYDSLSKENTVLKKDISNITKIFFKRI